MQCLHHSILFSTTFIKRYNSSSSSSWQYSEPKQFILLPLRPTLTLKSKLHASSFPPWGRDADYNIWYIYVIKRSCEHGQVVSGNLAGASCPTQWHCTQAVLHVDPTFTVRFARFRAGTRKRTIGCERLSIYKLPQRDKRSLKEFANMALASENFTMRTIGDKVFRFDANRIAQEQAFPSLSFLDPKSRESAFKDPNAQNKYPAFLPIFNIENKHQSVTFEFPSDTNFYGTGEIGGSLERSGKRIFTWNTDAWGYGKRTSSLYQSHPWVHVLLHDGSAFGVLADTTRRCEVDLRKENTIKFSADLPFPVVTFGPYSSSEGLLTALSQAIGSIPMPPKWALGYHQCRWSYEPAARVQEVARTFREKKLPCDVIWMDIDYMDGFRCFTFDPEKFGNPEELTKNLHSEGFKAVWMIDPGIKCETGYFVYDAGSSEDAWVLQADGKPYVGEVWPGPCVFPDFTQAKVRDWWSKLIRDFTLKGVDGIWNDMNEPAVFKTLSKTMPDTNIHNGDVNLGGSQNHLHYHNVYGMLMARSTFEGMLLARPNRRPFVLTRAGYVGSQRYAATWTGDNLSNWDHLHMSISMALNLGLSGQPFAGPDIGGFAGDATPKLFARWMGIGALLPFSRGHSESGTISHEPWSFGKECEDVCRIALIRRYRLLPHLYTLFFKAHTSGAPVMAPLFFADSKDLRLRHVEDSFLLGSVLVSANTHPTKSLNLNEWALPEGVWHRFNLVQNHPELPLLHLRGGSIIPLGPSIQHVGESNVEDGLTLVVSLDESGKAEGFLYEDDGEGYGYKRGEFLLSLYEAALPGFLGTYDGGEVQVKVKHIKGHWTRPKRPLQIILLIGDGAQVETTGWDGEEITVKVPAASVVEELVAASQKAFKAEMGSKSFEDQEGEANLGLASGRELIEISSAHWQLKVVPWIGGRIISMFHKSTGIEWLHSRLERGGYEEYSGAEYRSPGCVEEYSIIKKNIEESNGQRCVSLEGDIGGGLVLSREIKFSNTSDKVLQIESKIIARSVGAGSGGYSRLVCLRIHPTFQLQNPLETFVKFVSQNGVPSVYTANIGEIFLRDHDKPNGEWMLFDPVSGLALVNRFNVDEVDVCLIHWGPYSCNLELWSEERPVSKDSPISVHHEYEVISV